MLCDHFLEGNCYMSVWLWWLHYVKPMLVSYSSYDLGFIANIMCMLMVMIGLFIGAAFDEVIMIGDPYLCTPLWMCE